MLHTVCRCHKQTLNCYFLVDVLYLSLYFKNEKENFMTVLSAIIKWSAGARVNTPYNCRNLRVTWVRYVSLSYEHISYCNLSVFITYGISNYYIVRDNQDKWENISCQLLFRRSHLFSLCSYGSWKTVCLLLLVISWVCKFFIERVCFVNLSTNQKTLI